MHPPAASCAIGSTSFFFSYFFGEGEGEAEFAHDMILCVTAFAFSLNEPHCDHPIFSFICMSPFCFFLNLDNDIQL